MNYLFVSLRTALFLLTLGFFFPLQAQFIIRGTVSDASSKEAMVGAAVMIGGENIGTFTDETGAYRLELKNLTQKTVQLRILFTGYATEEMMISLNKPEIIQNVQLQPEGIFADDVVITATKGFEQKQSDVTVSMEVVKPDRIDLQATPNIRKVINQIPGVDEQDGQINIRGSSGYAYGVGSRVMVTLDGLPLLTGDAGSVSMDLIPVDNIAQVEVLKGASSVLYGSGALGGVINVISASPGDKPRTSVRVRGGMFDAPANKALDWDGDKNAYFGSAHLFHTRKIGTTDLVLQTDFIKDSGYRQETDKEQFRGILGAKFRPKSIPGLTLGMNLTARIDSGSSALYWRGYEPDTLNGEISGGALTPTLDNGGLRRSVSTHYALDPSVKYLTPGGNLFWYRGRLLRNTNQGSTDQDSRNLIFYNDFLYQTTLFDKVSWVSGATYTYSQAKGDSLFSGTVEGITPMEEIGKHEGHALGVYTQLDGKFGKLNASLGFRIETVQIDELERETEPIFRGGLNYELWKGANIRGSFGQAFRVPTVAERFTSTTGGGLIVRPNPFIKSEKGYSAELGLRQGYRFGTKKSGWQGYIDVAAFVMRFDNMVEFGLDTLVFGFDPDQGLTSDIEFTSVNVADAEIRGIEVTTINSGQWGDWRVNISGGFTLLDPKDLNAVPESQQLDLSRYPDNLLVLIGDIVDPDIQDQPEFLKYRSKFIARASTSLGYKKWGITANYRRKSFVQSIDQYLYAVVGGLNAFREKHPNGEHLLDLILAYNLTDQMQLSFNVDNAFNEEYLTIPGTLAPQRSFTLQYLVRF